MADMAGCGVGCDARDSYSDGRNCAESVIGAIGRLPGAPDLPDVFGAGFTGGIGHSGCVCGALAGGVAVLGEHAKAAGLDPVATRVLAEELSAELHAHFTDEFGAACCRVIKRGQTEGSDEWMSGCASLTEWTASTVAEMVADSPSADTRARMAPQDIVSATRRAAADSLAGGAFAAAVSWAAPVGAEPVFALTVIAIVVLAVALEFGGASSRRAGRVVRVAGGAAAAVLLVATLFAPGLLVAHVAELLASDAWAVRLALGLLAFASLVSAALAAFRFKRYR